MLPLVGTTAAQNQAVVDRNARNVAAEVRVANNSKIERLNKTLVAISSSIIPVVGTMIAAGIACPPLLPVMIYSSLFVLGLYLIAMGIVASKVDAVSRSR